MGRLTLGNRLAWAVMGVLFSVLAAVGVIAGVAVAIPHAGAHGHEPTVLGYIALYALGCFLLMGAGIVIWFCFYGAFSNDA